MTKKFYLMLVAALLCLGGNMKAETVEEDFDFTISVTYADPTFEGKGFSEYCTITADKGTYAMGPSLTSGTMHIYAGNTLTFTVKQEGWTLKSITFAGVSNPTLSASEGTIADNAWTGNTATVTFTNTGSSQVKPTGIHVVYEKPAQMQKVEEDFDFEGTYNDGVWTGFAKYSDFAGDKGSNSMNNKPILNNGTMRIYGGNTITITVKDASWNIRSIKFAGISTTDLSASVGTFDTDTWTGEAKSVTFTNNGSKQIKPTGIHVVYDGVAESTTLAKPTFSPVGKAVGKDISTSDIVDDEQAIEISAAEDASIYYTLDGTTPTVESTLYTEPIVIRNSCTVSAIAVKGDLTSDVVAYRYFIHKHDADAFYYESFDGTAYWGGNDGDFNPNMQYSSTTLILDNDNATYSGCRAAEQAAFLDGGTFQTPNFSQPVKQGTLTFRVAGRTTGATTVNVTASAGTLSVASVTAKAGEWTDYTVIVSNMPAGAYIQFDGTGFLDEIKLVSTAEVVKPTVTIGATGYASFCYGEPLLFPEAVKVYAAYIMTDGYVKLEEVVNKDVPANTGVILVASPGDYELDYTGDITSATTEIMKLNDLKAATTDVATTGIYVLAEEDGKVGFHPMESGVLAAGKAYLEAADVEAVLAEGARFIAIDNDEVITGVKGVHITVDAGGRTFDLQGRRTVVGRGIIIENGKKYIK